MLYSHESTVGKDVSFVVVFNEIELYNLSSNPQLTVWFHIFILPGIRDPFSNQFVDISGTVCFLRK